LEAFFLLPGVENHKRNPGYWPGFLYQKLKYYLAAGVVLLAAGLPFTAVVDLAVVVVLVLAAGFVVVLAVAVFVVVLDCFDVVAVCAEAAKVMVAATNKSARFLIVFICLSFNCE
jgi:hypothetical protein